MNSLVTIRLERHATDQPWGFRLQGGCDFSVPLSIQLVNPNTPAHANGLNAGDQVISINGRNVTDVTHQDAKMEITRTGNELELTVIKGAVNQQSIPISQPLSQLQSFQKVKPNSPLSNQRQTHIKSQTSDAPVSHEIVKSTNWQPGGYTKETPEHLRPKVSSFESSPAYNRDPLVREIWRPKAYRDNPQAPARHVGTAVYHAQYNSPIGLYSDDKVLEAFKSQTGGLIDEITGNNFSQSSMNYNDNNNIHHQPSPTYQAVMNCEQQKNIPYSSEGKISRSFRALEQDIHSVHGTSRAPKSIFDQRRQQQQ